MGDNDEFQQVYGFSILRRRIRNKPHIYSIDCVERDAMQKVRVERWGRQHEIIIENNCGPKVCIRQHNRGRHRKQ